MLLLFPPVILVCISALTVLLAPLAGIQGRRNLYAGLAAHRDPAHTLLDGSVPPTLEIVVPPAFDGAAVGNLSAIAPLRLLSLPPVFLNTVPLPPPSFSNVSHGLALMYAAFDSPPASSDYVKSSLPVREAGLGGDILPSTALLALAVLLGLLIVFRCKVVHNFRQWIGLTALEAKKLALQTALDGYMRNAFSRAAHIAAMKVHHSHEQTLLAYLERSAATFVGDLQTIRIDIAEAQASKAMADAQSSDLRTYFDVLLAREQFREELHAQHIAWLDERYSALEAQQANLKLLLLSEDSSAPLHQVAAQRDIEVLELSFKASKAKFQQAEVDEQQQLANIVNLEQDLEAENVKSDRHSQERSDLEQVCGAIQDQTTALQTEHEERSEALKAQIADAERAITEAVQQTAILAEQGDTLHVQIDEVQAAFISTQQDNSHILGVAEKHTTELKADIAAADTDIEKLQQVNTTTGAELPALVDNADAFETLASKAEAENDVLESQVVDEDTDYSLWSGVLSAEHEDLLDEQARAETGLTDLKVATLHAQESAANKTKDIQAEQALGAEQHSNKMTTFRSNIADNDATIESLKTQYKALKATFISSEAQYTTRLAEFTKAEEQCTEDIEATMILSREAAFDLQQYQSLSVEATRKQREAENNAVRAVERAQKAQEQSTATDKEMRISRCAFSTQVKDVEAQCTDLEERAEELRQEAETLCATNTQLAAEVSRQTTEFGSKAAFLRDGIAEADADIQTFDAVQAEILKRMDTHIATMQTKRARLQDGIQGYAGMVDDADGVIAQTIHEREEEEDARSAAEGQAEGLSLLLLSPKTPSAGTPGLEFASSSTPSPGSSPCSTPELEMELEPEVIFDASLEEPEVEAGALVESETVKALAPSNVGLGILL